MPIGELGKACLSPAYVSCYLLEAAAGCAHPCISPGVWLLAVGAGLWHLALGRGVCCL